MAWCVGWGVCVGGEGEVEEAEEAETTETTREAR